MRPGTATDGAAWLQFEQEAVAAGGPASAGGSFDGPSALSAPLAATAVELCAPAAAASVYVSPLRHVVVSLNLNGGAAGGCCAAFQPTSLPHYARFYPSKVPGISRNLAP